MNLLLISIDSLRRDFLSTYLNRPRGFNYTVDTSNLDRFAKRATVFETHYAGSQFCMPTRREWLTGIKEFLWRPWGPIEPFDRTLPLAARENGSLTKLITDHYHYFQHGAHGYFEDFNGFDFIRGHEYDAWKTSPRTPDSDFRKRIKADDPHSLGFMNRAQYARNIDQFDFEDESDFFGPKVFSRTAEWLRENQAWDEWFCYVDSFDVHEPLHVPEPYASMYTDEDPQDIDLPVWPFWGDIESGQSSLTERELEFVRAQFAGKVTMVDKWFGRILDVLDDKGLWDNTVVIVTSDHGFSLGDHGWLGKLDTPLYDTIVQTPLMIHHPGSDRDRVSELTAAIDLYPTMMELVGAQVPENTHGQSLLPLLTDSTKMHREAALFGLWGGGINITDGQYTYHHPCDTDVPAYCHSTMQINARGAFHADEPNLDAESGSFLPYTDAPVWRYTAPSYNRHESPLLFDTEADPGQRENLAPNHDATVQQMQELLVKTLEGLSAPEHQYERLNLHPR